jgi:protein-disulfide isomerase
VRIVFKHLPLDFHPYAFEAAEASLAAGAQGKFWEYHDLLFQNQRKLTRPDLEAYATQLGLDLVKFKQALDTDQFKAQVERDKGVAKKLGVRGTPNAFINGYNIRGAQPFSAFKTIIDRELAKARGEVPSSAAAPGAPNLGLFDKESFPIPTPGTLSVGNPAAPTEVVLYLDLQDEFSGDVLKTLKEMQNNNRRSVRLVVKHFPMGFHKEAARAGQAVESVAKRAPDKLWAYLTALSANHRSLSDARLVDIAKGLGVDGAGVKTDLAENTYLKQVNTDLELGRTRGAKATPTIFVNGRRYTGMKGYDSDALKTLLSSNARRSKKR